MLNCRKNFDVVILVQVIASVNNNQEVHIHASGYPRFERFYMNIDVWIGYKNRRVMLAIVSEISDQYERCQFWNFRPLVSVGEIMLMFPWISPMSSLELMSLLMIFLGPFIGISDSAPEVWKNAVKSLVDVMRFFEKAMSETIEQKTDSLTKTKWFFHSTQ